LQTQNPGMTTEFDEATVIEQVTARLTEKFPTANHRDVEKLVRQEVSALAGRPVNDYIAVLSERAVKKQLKKDG
jgi:hypothetical protein